MGRVISKVVGDGGHVVTLKPLLMPSRVSPRVRVKGALQLGLTRRDNYPLG